TRSRWRSPRSTAAGRSTWTRSARRAPRRRPRGTARRPARVTVVPATGVTGASVVPAAPTAAARAARAAVANAADASGIADRLHDGPLMSRARTRTLADDPLGGTVRRTVLANGL